VAEPQIPSFLYRNSYGGQAGRNDQKNKKERFPIHVSFSLTFCSWQFTAFVRGWAATPNRLFGEGCLSAASS